MKKILILTFATCVAIAAHATPPKTPPAQGGEASSTAVGVGLGLGLGLGLGVGIGQGGEGGKGGQGGVGQGGIGVGGTGGVGTGGTGVGDVAVDAGSGHTYVAPAPAVTIIPQSNGGIVTKSHAVGIVWNLFSWSKSEQMTDPFQGGMRMIAEYERLCQFETAAMIRQRLYAQLDPAYRELPAQPGVVNMTAEQCAARK